MAHVEALRKAGIDAFVVPAQISGKGVWFRVFVGGFDSASKATKAGQDLRSKGLIGEALVVSLPYAVEVTSTTPDQAAEAMAIAHRSGYLPILRSENGNPSDGSRQVLRVDAFPTSQEANRLAEILRAEGFSPRVIRRH